MPAILIACNLRNMETIVMQRRGDEVSLMTPDGWTHDMSYLSMQQTPDDPLLVGYPNLPEIVRALKSEDNVLRHITRYGVYRGMPNAHNVSYSQTRFLES